MFRCILILVKCNCGRILVVNSIPQGTQIKCPSCSATSEGEPQEDGCTQVAVSRSRTLLIPVVRPDSDAPAIRAEIFYGDKISPWTWRKIALYATALSLGMLALGVGFGSLIPH